MKTQAQIRCKLVISVGILLFCTLPLHAKKPDNPGGGNSGGGDGDSSQLQLVDLHPTGSVFSQASAINNAGIAVGSVDDVAGIWNTTATTPTFSPLPGSALSAIAINEGGAIVGSYAATTGPNYWASSTTAPIALPLPPGYTSGSAEGISRDGIIVGEVFGEQNSSAAAWRVSDGSVFGPVLFSDSVFYDVASLGSGVNRIVGTARDTTIPTGHWWLATAWDLDLNPDGSFSVSESSTLVSEEYSIAYAITERGDVSGKWFGTRTGANLDTTEEGAFVIRNGSLKLLDGGGGKRQGIGYDLNDNDVVGATGNYYWSLLRYATLWNSRNRPEDLSAEYFDENWSRAIAYGINDGGDIVGFGQFGEAGHAWLLRATPAALSTSAAVPEPSTLLLAGFGGFILLFARRHNLHVHAEDS